MQDYVNASDCYEQLTQLYPDQVQYKLYYAQSLYKCGLYSEAMKISGKMNKTLNRNKKYHKIKLNILLFLKAQIEAPSYQLSVRLNSFFSNS